MELVAVVVTEVVGVLEALVVTEVVGVTVGGCGVKVAVVVLVVVTVDMAHSSNEPSR